MKDWIGPIFGVLLLLVAGVVMYVMSGSDSESRVENKPVSDAPLALSQMEE